MQGSTRRRALESAGRIALGCYFGALGAGCGGLSNDGGDRVAEPEMAVEPAPSAESLEPTPAEPAPSAENTDPTPPEPSPEDPVPEPSPEEPVPEPSPEEPVPEPSPEDPVPEPSPEEPAPEPSPEEPVPALACVGLVEVVARRLVTPLGLEAEACCAAYVESVVGTGPARPGAELALDPSLLNCCRALAYEGSFDSSVAHTTCCDGGVLTAEDIQAPYCSPWGPPVPPALVLA